jgi:hypothetical protein
MFFVAGAGCAAEAVASFIKHIGYGFGWGLLAAFLFLLVRGLFRCQEWSRVVTCILIIYLLVLSSIALLASAVGVYERTFGPQLQKNGLIVGREWAVLIASIGACVYCSLVLRVSYRLECNKAFEMPNGHRSQIACNSLGPWRRFRFSIRAILMAMFVLSCLLARLTAVDVQYLAYERQGTWQIGRSHRSFRYKVRVPRLGKKIADLQFVILSEDRDALDVDEILRGGKQLHEIVNGIHRTRTERVTLEEFEGYLISMSREWSIDALLEHASNLRAKQAR